MATYIERGDSLFIPFRNGQSISDSQCRPRMYKSLQNFEKAFPKHNYGTNGIELVEYAEVKHGEWKKHFSYGCWHYDCPFCDDGFAMKEDFKVSQLPNYCSNCGAKMDGGKAE